MTQQLPLTTNTNIHIIATIPPHTIQYNPTPEWPNYYQHTEPLLTSIIDVHNQVNPTTNPQTPQELQRILKRITNKHIDTYPVKPTNPHYNVKFSNTWKNASKVNTTTQNITTPISPLPITYSHTHSLKYPPQQCMYTDRSFIPPSKNSEGQIIGNIAGS